MFFKLVKNMLSDETIVKLKKITFSYKKKCMLKKVSHIKAVDLKKYSMGINLLGDIRSETGLGQSMRILARMIKEAEIPFVIKQINSPGRLMQNVSEWDEKINENVIYSINLIHINPNIWLEGYLNIDSTILDYRYNIGFWLWELENFPKEWVAFINAVDEIWTPSEFISNSIRKRTSKPVTTVPYSISTNIHHMYNRDYFNISKQQFLFLIMYDLQSNSERKNPQGAIKAFMKAFDPEERNIGLVLKVSHLKCGKELNRIKEQLKGYSNVYYIEKNLSRDEVESLINAVDVLVSLHRAEGFGLPLAEAMCLGTPVVATNWSANTEFMDVDSSCLVDFSIIKLEKNIGIYKKGNRWADADINHAADYMRKLYQDKQFYEKIKRNGKEKIKNHSGIKKMKIRIDEIYEVTNV